MTLQLYTTPTSTQGVQAARVFELSELHVFAPVPEPQTYLMMLAGLALVGGVALRKRRERSA